MSIHKTELSYKCKYCTRMFKNSAARNNHHQIAHKNKNELNFYCNYCKIYFETKEDLRVHSFIHFEGEIKSCHVCDQIFKTTRLLNIHMQKHSDSKFQCESCKQMFAFKTGLKKHLRLNRCKGAPIDFDANDDGQITQEEIAQIAKEQIKSISNKQEKSEEPKVLELRDVIIKEEIYNLNTNDELNEACVESDDGTIEDLILEECKITKDESEIKPKRVGRTHNTYTCDKCGEIIKYRKNLESHMKEIHLRKHYKCPYCPEVFKNKSNFKSHSLSVHGIKQRIAADIYKCTVCEKTFDIKSIFETHKRSHDNIRSHICKICAASFKSFGNLKRHMSIHLDYRNYLCDACPKSFKSQSALKIHKNSVHADTKVYVLCPYCNIIIQEKNLKIHIFNQHTEEGQKKPFSCNDCDMNFKNEFLLKRHYEHLHFSTNRGVNYKCEECGLEFNRQRDLRVHSFEHYDGEIFNCTQCKKKFKSKRLLLTHSTTHNSSNNNFPCNHCEVTFKTPGGRRKHLVKYHKGTSIEEKKVAAS